MTQNADVNFKADNANVLLGNGPAVNLATELAEVKGLLAGILAALNTKPVTAVSTGRTTAPGAVADEKELDGQYGDPAVFKSPKGWEGLDYTGQKYSQCSSEFLLFLADDLDSYADYCDAQGLKDKKGGPKSAWTRRDASRARGWAKRNEGKGALSKPVADPDF